MACEINLNQIRGLYAMFTGYSLDNRNVNTAQFCSYLEKSLERNMNPEFLKHIQGFKIIGIYGMGGNGLVLKLCKDGKCFALKMMKTPQDKEEYKHVLNEVKIQEKFAEFDAAPKILNQDQIGSSKIVLHGELDPSKSIMETPVTLLKMQAIETDFHHAILKRRLTAENMNTIVLNIIDLFYLKTFKVGYIHGDLHTSNLAILPMGMVFIDFGWSRLAESHVEHFVDFISLIGSLKDFATNDDTQKKFTLELAETLMYCCNYLYGTEFKNLDSFERLGQFASYVYMITDDIAIGHNYPLSDRGIFKLDKNGNKVKYYSDQALSTNWKNLSVDENKFKILTKVIETVGYEFIIDFGVYNSNC